MKALLVHMAASCTCHRALSLSFPIEQTLASNLLPLLGLKYFLLLPKLLSLKLESVAGFVLLKGQEQSSVCPFAIKSFYLYLFSRGDETNLLDIFFSFPINDSSAFPII